MEGRKKAARSLWRCYKQKFMCVDAYKPAKLTFFFLIHSNLTQARRPPLSDPCDMNVGAGTQGWGRTGWIGSSAKYSRSNSPKWSQVIVQWSLQFTSGLTVRCYIFSVGCHCCCAYFFIRTFVHLNVNMAPLINCFCKKRLELIFEVILSWSR